MIIVDSWKTRHGDIVEVFQSHVGADFHWHVQADGNNEIGDRGEGHPNKADAVAAAERHHPPVTSGE